ncbi:LRC26 protein, partial [Acromyrmex charruanus]
MQAAPSLLSFLLIFLYHSGWTHGLCKLKNSTTAWCDQLKDLKDIETHDLETLSAPVAQDILIPGLFDNLTSLRHLDLSDGDLKKIEPGSFRTLNNLKSLNLGDNRIEYLDLASLEGLIHLRSLNLRRNVIRQLPPALARLKNLKHLDIHGNPLECNCATLKVRDLIVQRGVTVSKKVVCAGPGNMKGTSLMKPSAMIICNFEEQDREMQNDQAEGSGESDLGSGDVLDGFNEEEEEEGEEEDIENKNSTSEEPKESEVETPFPTVLIDSTIESSTSKITVEVTTGTTMNSLQHSTEDEEIFFDNEDKREQTSTTEMSQKKNIKDVLFYPTAGSGDGDEGSGEGSGATGTHYDEEETERADTSEGFFATGAGFFNTLFGFGTSVTTSTTKEPNLEEEEFIHVSTTNLATEETIVSVKSYSVEADNEKSTEVTTKAIPRGHKLEMNDVVLASSDIVDDSKSGSMMDRGNNEQAVSSPKQSKKGMGSYVVLAVLLAIVVALIGFAAYRGDICKKRKSRDVETGTEMKEIQKSLLEHGENSTQPKKEENTPYVTELESDPLVKVKSAGDDAKIDEIHDDDYQTRETPRLNGTVDHSELIKPPRKQLLQDENAILQDDEVREERPRVDINSLKKNFLEDRNPQPSTSATTNGPTTHFPEPNGPPLSPGAQRVKITLQEIPDSVPKTPILITRTMAGENLVKTP